MVSMLASWLSGLGSTVFFMFLESLKLWVWPCADNAAIHCSVDTPVDTSIVSELVIVKVHNKITTHQEIAQISIVLRLYHGGIFWAKISVVSLARDVLFASFLGGRGENLYIKSSDMYFIQSCPQSLYVFLVCGDWTCDALDEIKN